MWFNSTMDSTLLPFFKPRGVVLFGASTSEEKLGYGVARNLTMSGYPGPIHFVGQKPGELFGRPIFTDVKDVPDPVDLAILIVPPKATPETIETCGNRGIHSAVIVSAGFREVGEEGARLEFECLERARKFGIRLLGPNCIGTIDTHLPMDTTFLQPPMPAQGGIGFISHSGAFCAAIVDWSRGQGFGFSRIVSLGNQADVNETDMLPLLASDPHTRVIVLYMEGVSEGRRFVQVAAEIANEKPILALKVGRFEAGQKAAASHTGALAASDTAFEAAFVKSGVLRAETAEQMFDWARALEYCPLPKGRRMAILTNAGGPGVIAADAIKTYDMELALLSEHSKQALASYLPAAASVINPVDMLASASPEIYGACLKVLLEEERVDGVMVILPPPPMFKAEDVAQNLVGVIRQFNKPVVVALMGSPLIETAVKVLTLAKVPAYPFPERAASALAALNRRADFIAQKSMTMDQKVPAIGSSDARTAEEMVETFGIQTARAKLAQDAHACGKIASELGFPVVLKIASRDISHKSDVGGVLTGIQDEGSARNGYTIIIDRVTSARPEAKIEGVYIQKQVDGGQEVIAGAVHDPQFGPLIMFGSGGVEVEGLKDVAFALAPLTRIEAKKMIEQTWAGRKLKGFRNIPPADEESVIDVLVNLSHLMIQKPDVGEIEINPLKVLTRGAVALDVRIRHIQTG